MTEIVVSLSRLRLLVGSRLDSLPHEQWPDGIAAMFHFLPGVLEIRIEGDNAIICFPGNKAAVHRVCRVSDHRSEGGHRVRTIRGVWGGARDVRERKIRSRDILVAEDNVRRPTTAFEVSLAPGRGSR